MAASPHPKSRLSQPPRSRGPSILRAWSPAMPSRFSRSGFAVERRRLAAMACFVLAVLCSSCSPNGRKPVYPVHGLVLVEGRPPAHAQVTFHPAANDGQEAIHPTGSVDDQGRFTLTSYASGDGAPEGEYH